METRSLVGRIVKLASAAARGGYGVLSIGEKVAVALVLNRPDWLAELNYTLAEAIERLGADWLAAIPEAAAEFNRETNEKAYEAAERVRSEKLDAAKQASRNDALHLASTLVTYGSAPGYRDASLTFDLQQVGGDEIIFRADVSIRPEDAESIVRHLKEVHQLAWRRGEPLDVQPGEKRPAWIDR